MKRFYIDKKPGLFKCFDNTWTFNLVIDGKPIHAAFTGKYEETDTRVIFEFPDEQVIPWFLVDHIFPYEKEARPPQRDLNQEIPITKFDAQQIVSILEESDFDKLFNYEEKDTPPETN